MKCNIERRKNTRHKVKDDIIVMLGRDSDKMGPMIDISTKGLSFYHTKIDPVTNHPNELTIFGMGSPMNCNFLHYGFNVKTVCDEVEIQANTKKICSKYRCSVQFIHLEQNQVLWIDDFIKNYTVGAILNPSKEGGGCYA